MEWTKNNIKVQESRNGSFRTLATSFRVYNRCCKWMRSIYSNWRAIFESLLEKWCFREGVDFYSKNQTEHRNHECKFIPASSIIFILDTGLLLDFNWLLTCSGKKFDFFRQKFAVLIFQCARMKTFLVSLFAALSKMWEFFFCRQDYPGIIWMCDLVTSCSIDLISVRRTFNFNFVNKENGAKQKFKKIFY